MQTYVYRAKDPSGNHIKATVEAASVAEASKLLMSRQLFPLDIREQPKGIFSQESLDKLQRVSAKDKVLLTRQLATLIKAGLPLGRSLKILMQQTANPKLKKVVASLSASIEGGSSLSAALKMYPQYFSTIYLSMVEAGEASGSLDETLVRLANQEEKSADINSKIKGAFTYPVVVLFVLVAVAGLMITTILPQVGKMYVDLKKPLPLSTQILLGISSFFIHFWYICLLIIGAAIYGIRVFIKSDTGRRLFDRSKFQLPGFKVLVNKLYMARFARTLGSLINSGVPVLQALAITSRSMNNIILQDELNIVTEKVKSGIALSTLVEQSPHFLSLVSQMLAVGEETGTVGDSLSKLADYYEGEVDQAIKTISTLIEPATMIILGTMVGGLIAAVLLPIYGLVSSIH